MVIKNELNANSLITAMQNFFSTVTDQLSSNSSISLKDGLMCGLAMFSLKEKSLLSFEHNIMDYGPNLKTVYGIDNIPTDTHLRTMLDPIPTDALRPAFKLIFNRLQRSNFLQEFKYFDDYYLVSIDAWSENIASIIILQCLSFNKVDTVLDPVQSALFMVKLKLHGV